MEDTSHYSKSTRIHDDGDFRSNELSMSLDVNSYTLRATISQELGTSYLSKIETMPTAEGIHLSGRFCGENRRMMINIPTSLASTPGNLDGSKQHPSYNVIFLVDTTSPYTYICEEVKSVLMGAEETENSGAVPSSMWVQMADFPAVEAHFSPPAGFHNGINVIGMDLLYHLQTTIYGLDGEFELSYVAPTET